MKALEVHRKLLRILPVRTHVMRNDDPQERARQGRRTNESAEKLRRAVKELLARGMKPMQIADHLGERPHTIYNCMRSKKQR